MSEMKKAGGRGTKRGDWRSGIKRNKRKAQVLKEV